MKTLFTIILSFCCLICFGQATSFDTVQSVAFRYFATNRDLQIDFEDNLNATITIDFDKYPDLKSITIFNYSKDNKSILHGLNGGSVRQLAFAYSDFNAFAAHNELPEDLIKFSFWKYPLTPTDTLFLPEELEKWAGLRYVGIGCCGIISLDKVDLTKLKNLDTLILEGPIYDLNSVAKLRDLVYLGLWSSSWSQENFKQQLDTLLPNTKKESVCFPPNQQVLLYNGQIKAIQNIIKGDTLLSYDFNICCFVPNVVVEVIEHGEFNYTFCNVYSLDNLVATLGAPYLEPPKSVIATVNHPIISGNGCKIPIGDISTEEFVYYANNKGIEIINVEHKQLFSERTKVYNLITEKNNYFVNGYLFADK